jgi:hypothetical protein
MTPFGIFQVFDPSGAFVGVDAGCLDRIEARWPAGSRFINDSPRLVEHLPGEVVADGIVRPLEAPQAPEPVVPEPTPPPAPAKALKPMGRYVRDRGEIETHARAAIEAHPGEAARYRGGKPQLANFFIAKVIERTQGGADPQITREVLIEVLGVVAASP